MKCGDRVRIVNGKYTGKIGVVAQMFRVGNRNDYIVQVDKKFALLCSDEDIAKLENKLEKEKDKNNTKEIDELYEMIKRLWGSTFTLNGLSNADLLQIFGTQNRVEILGNKTAYDFMNAIKKWDEKQKEEIKVGDILIHKRTKKAYVVSCIDNYRIDLISEMGTIEMHVKEQVKNYFNKTNTNISENLNDFLKGIGEAQ